MTADDATTHETTGAPDERRVWLGSPRRDRVGPAPAPHGHTDVPLTDRRRARRPWRSAGGSHGHPFGLVLTSPLSRATETARLAGFGDVAVRRPRPPGVGLRRARGPA